jgi:hypothetical protein
MDDELTKHLAKDPDGLLTYEYIANNIADIDPVIDDLIQNMVRVDASGQFCVSAARYLNAIDPEKFTEPVKALVSAAIDKDRERAYIGQLLAELWGEDYAEHADEISARDDNFRRIYKRLFPSSAL